MLEEIFNEFDKVIQSPPNDSKTGMPAGSITDVNNDEGINVPKKGLPLVKQNSSGLKTYTIIPETRNLIINDKVYEIDDFFNIKNAIAGDFKTLDYIFTYKGFNIREFEIKEHKV